MILWRRNILAFSFSRRRVLAFKKFNYLEPQTTIYKWLFQLDDSKSLHGKWLFNQRSIKNWLFRVPGIYIYIINSFMMQEPNTITIEQPFDYLKNGTVLKQEPMTGIVAKYKLEFGGANPVGRALNIYSISYCIIKHSFLRTWFHYEEP